MKTTRNGFTLVELLVVITIVGVLGALVGAGLSKAKMRGYQTASVNNLRQWGIALTASLSDYDNRLPSTGMIGDAVDILDQDAWFNRLPNYISEVPLSNPLAMSLTPKYGQKSIWVNPAIPYDDFLRYSKPPTRLFSYAMNGWLSTTAEPTMPKLRIESATSTVFMGEQGEDKSELRPETLRAYLGPGDVVNFKENAAHFLFCDGRVELIKRETFDPRFVASGHSPIDTALLNPGFSYVPAVGAVAD